MRRTKIIATLGPASSEPAVLSRMIRAGMDVARLNLSHGSRASHARAIRAVRAEAHRLGRHVGLLLDLQGPKLRVGEFVGGHVRLRAGDTVTLTNRAVKGTPSGSRSSTRASCATCAAATACSSTTASWSCASAGATPAGSAAA